MKITEEDFEALVDRAMEAAGAALIRPVIQKELLHYDILFCLDQAGLLDDLVFQGGTSLRLCYGSHRYSEDLDFDFVGGRDFSSARLAGMKHCLEDYLGARYGLEVAVKEPATLKQEPDHAELNVDRWQIAVVTAPARRDLPKQRIKIEVANVPAYATEVMPLRVNYELLPDGYDDVLIVAESRNEIMADKLVSLAASRRYVRHRDIWDLSWLKQQGATVQPDLVERKIEDYRQPDYPALLDSIMAAIPSIIAGAAFKNEMKRFLPADVYARSMGKDKFERFLVSSITHLFEELRQKLYN